MALRTETSSSVLFVATMGAIALLAVMAVTDSLIGAERNVSTQVNMNEASSAAENALQYSVALLNQSASVGTLSSLSSPIVIPTTLTGRATVTVAMTNLPLAALQTPLGAASPQSAISNQANLIAVYNLQSGANSQLPFDFRLLSAQAQVGSFKRTINVIVGPNPYSPQSSPSQQFFNSALTANQTLKINGVNVALDPSYVQALSNQVPQSFYGSTQGLLAASNNQLQISGTSQIAGSITANSYSTPTMSGTPQTSPLTVLGNVYYQGSTPPTNFIADPGGAGNPSANVLGDGLATSTPTQANQAGSISQSTSSAGNIPALAPAPIQSAIGSAQIAVNGSPGSQVTTVGPLASGAVSDLGSVSLSGTDNVVITPGQYTANSFTSSSQTTTTISIPANGGTSGNVVPVQLYLQGDTTNLPGNNGTSGVLQLNGNVKMTGTPAASNFQIYYNGNQSINVTMGAASPKFYGQIYAPNANVTVDTTGGEFHGAIVANNLTVSGTGSFFYDPRSVSTAAGVPGAAVSPGYSPNQGGASSFSVLSWQEITTGMQ